MSDSKIADEIYRQLGGSKFSTMVGPKQLVSGPNYLTIALPRRAEQRGVTSVRVTLDLGSDEYKVESFRWIAKKLEYQRIDFVDGVQVDGLQEAFTRLTGLETHL